MWQGQLTVMPVTSWTELTRLRQSTLPGRPLRCKTGFRAEPQSTGLELGLGLQLHNGIYGEAYT